MKRHARTLGQLLLYAALAAAIGLFSRWPSWQALAPEMAVVKLSVQHQGQRLGECVERSLEELAKLPPNMRAPTRCPRERSPVSIELEIDGELVLRQTAAPAGLKRDGASSIYRRLQLPAGSHHFLLRLSDDQGLPGFNHQREQTLTLAPAQILVIDFDSANGEILFR